MREVPDSCQVPDQLTNVTGSFGQTQSELTLPGLGGGLSFERTYNSPDTRTDGPLGAGWSHGYETRVQALPGTTGAVNLIRPTGRFTTFSNKQADETQGWLSRRARRRQALLARDQGRRTSSKWQPVSLLWRSNDG
jgi:hypothetical protein